MLCFTRAYGHNSFQHADRTSLSGDSSLVTDLVALPDYPKSDYLSDMLGFLYLFCYMREAVVCLF